MTYKKLVTLPPVETALRLGWKPLGKQSTRAKKNFDFFRGDVRFGVLVLPRGGLQFTVGNESSTYPVAVMEWLHTAASREAA
jgi:hypothetical protein